MELATTATAGPVETAEEESLSLRACRLFQAVLAFPALPLPLAASGSGSANQHAKNAGAQNSKIRGVTQHRRTGRYEAHIWDDKRQMYLGGWTWPITAAKVHDLMAIKCRGLKTLTNYDVSTYATILPLLQSITKESLTELVRRHAPDGGPPVMLPELQLEPPEDETKQLAPGSAQQHQLAAAQQPPPLTQLMMAAQAAQKQDQLDSQQASGRRRRRQQVPGSAVSPFQPLEDLQLGQLCAHSQPPPNLAVSQRASHISTAAAVSKRHSDGVISAPTRVTKLSRARALTTLSSPMEPARETKRQRFIKQEPTAEERQWKVNQLMASYLPKLGLAHVDMSGAAFPLGDGEPALALQVPPITGAPGSTGVPAAAASADNGLAGGQEREQQHHAPLMDTTASGVLSGPRYVAARRDSGHQARSTTSCDGPQSSLSAAQGLVLLHNAAAACSSQQSQGPASGSVQQPPARVFGGQQAGASCAWQTDRFTGGPAKRPRGLEQQVYPQQMYYSGAGGGSVPGSGNGAQWSTGIASSSVATSARRVLTRVDMNSMSPRNSAAAAESAGAKPECAEMSAVAAGGRPPQHQNVLLPQPLSVTPWQGWDQQWMLLSGAMQQWPTAGYPPADLSCSPFVPVQHEAPGSQQMAAGVVPGQPDLGGAQTQPGTSNHTNAADVPMDSSWGQEAAAAGGGWTTHGTQLVVYGPTPHHDATPAHGGSAPTVSPAAGLPSSIVVKPAATHKPLALAPGGQISWFQVSPEVLPAYSTQPCQAQQPVLVVGGKWHPQYHPQQMYQYSGEPDPHLLSDPQAFAPAPGLPPASVLDLARTADSTAGGEHSHKAVAAINAPQSAVEASQCKPPECTPPEATPTSCSALLAPLGNSTPGMPHLQSWFHDVHSSAPTLARAAGPTPAGALASQAAAPAPAAAAAAAAGGDSKDYTPRTTWQPDLCIISPQVPLMHMPYTSLFHMGYTTAMAATASEPAVAAAGKPADGGFQATKPTRNKPLMAVQVPSSLPDTGPPTVSYTPVTSLDLMQWHRGVQAAGSAAHEGSNPYFMCGQPNSHDWAVQLEQLIRGSEGQMAAQHESFSPPEPSTQAAALIQQTVQQQEGSPTLLQEGKPSPPQKQQQQEEEEGPPPPQPLPPPQQQQEEGPPPAPAQQQQQQQQEEQEEEEEEKQLLQPLPVQQQQEKCPAKQQQLAAELPAVVAVPTAAETVSAVKVKQEQSEEQQGFSESGQHRAVKEEAVGECPGSAHSSVPAGSRSVSLTLEGAIGEESQAGHLKGNAQDTLALSGSLSDQIASLRQRLFGTP